MRRFVCLSYIYIFDREMGSLIVVSGPSGVGKGTILKELKAKYGSRLQVTVSHTTREPRVGETEGVQYFFVDQETFREKIAEGDFLEYAEFSGNCYGTSWAEVKRLGQLEDCIALLEIELNGMQQIQRKVEAGELKAHFIFIKPPTFEELERRLRGRGSDSNIELRLQTAKHEMDLMEQLHADLIVVNDTVEKARDEIHRFIQTHYSNIQ